MPLEGMLLDVYTEQPQGTVLLLLARKRKLRDLKLKTSSVQKRSPRSTLGKLLRTPGSMS